MTETAPLRLRADPSAHWRLSRASYLPDRGVEPMSLLRRWAERSLAGLAIVTASGGQSVSAAEPKKSSPSATSAAFAILSQPATETPDAERQPSSAPPAPGQSAPALTGSEDFFGDETWRNETWHDETWEGYLPTVWSHWTVNLDAVIWRRSTPNALQLAMSDTDNPAMPPDAGNLTFDHEAGPRLALIRRGISGWDVELNFLGIEGWTSRIDAPGAVDLRVPSDDEGGLFTSQLPLGITLNGLFVHYQSHLFNEELNLRRQLNETWTGIIGFRALQIYERFDINQGAVTDAFLSIETENRLYGLQAGGEGRLFAWGPATLTTSFKAGLFENNSEQSTADVAGFTSGSAVPARITASTNQASFVAEVGLLGSYQIAETIFLRAGYHVMWVDDISLAPDQFTLNEFQTFPPPPITELEGITAKDSLVYHGAVVGLELTW